MTTTELYSEQDVEAKVVVPELRRLGYDEEARPDVSLRFQYPVTVQQGRERRALRADVVVLVGDSPVIVVDSKNPRKYLTDNDREQVISYARLLPNIAPYAALCNGSWQVFDAITKRDISAIPSYTGLLTDLRQRRLSTRQRDALVSQATRTLLAIDSVRDLSRLMRRCHDIIRNLRGYDPTRAFDELSKLLFAKMFEERELAEHRREVNRFSLEVVTEMRQQGVEIVQALWKETVESDRYREVFSDEEAVSGVELPAEAIDAIVGLLEGKSLGLTDLDVKGVAFEEFLASTYRGGGLGQYFTPRQIVNFMVDLVDPAIGEKIVDPACGTGGFLIRSYDVVIEKVRASELSESQKRSAQRDLADNCLVGIDWEARAARTCKMNMIIHGDGHAGVYQANALNIDEVNEKVRHRRIAIPDAPGVEDGTYDVVLTNPPFGARDNLRSILDNYEMGRNAAQAREILLLERCIRLLRPGGRMAAVIPEGVLSNKTATHIRSYIMRECLVRAVIRLPQDAFAMSEGAACTSVIYLIKKHPQHREEVTQGPVFFARAEHIGITPSGKPIDENDLIAIKENFDTFAKDEYSGIQISGSESGWPDAGRATVANFEEDDSLWIEPQVNRTSLLYDRYHYVFEGIRPGERFGYTFNHPKYYQIMQSLGEVEVAVAALENLCESGYPTRGKKPGEEAVEGIPILKVRNVTGQGIDLDTEYAPNSEGVLEECERSLVRRGDLLITSTGEGTIGRVELWPYDDLAIADGHLAICRLRKDIADPRYVLEFLRGEMGQVQMLRHVSGSTGQTELLIGHVQGLRVPLPPRAVQEEIVREMREAYDQSAGMLDQAEDYRRRSIEVVARARHSMTRAVIEASESS